MKKIYIIAAGAAGILTIAAGTYLTDLGQVASVRPGDLFYVVTNTASGGSKSISATNLAEGLRLLAGLATTNQAANCGSNLVAVSAGGGISVATNFTDGKTVYAVSGGPTASNAIPVTLAYEGTNVAVDAALGTHFRLTITNAFLLQSPAHSQDGQRIMCELIQDATGIRTMVLDSAFKLGADIPTIVLTTNAGQRDFLTAVCNGTNWYVVGFIRGF